MRITPVAAALLAAATLSAQTPTTFRLEETTIAQIQSAFRDGSLTCRTLVERYLARIDAHDKQGAALNAIVMINPDALNAADELDRRFRQSGPVGPMHCVPVLVKDNYETIDMPTTAGSLSLKGMMTGVDAFIVKRLRDAGASDDRQVEHGGIRVQSGRNGELDSARLHAQSVRHEPGDGGIERRIRRRRGGELRGDRPRQRHR